MFSQKGQNASDIGLIVAFLISLVHMVQVQMKAGTKPEDLRLNIHSKLYLQYK